MRFPLPHLRPAKTVVFATAPTVLMLVIRPEFKAGSYLVVVRKTFYLTLLR